MPSLSLVITTYNRESVLQRLLETLKLQEDPDFQVVVAIDGSTDGTAAMLAAAHTPFDLKWVDTHCSGYGLAVARNMGILAADGRAIVILDDDGIPDPGFVAAHKRSVMRGVVTGGPRIPSEGEDEYLNWKMAELAKLPNCSPAPLAEFKRKWPNAYITECNMCMFRDDIIEMGMFSERMKIYGFIGQEFFSRATYLGYGYQFNHDAPITLPILSPGNDRKTRKKKMRQAKIASLLNPSLMTPRHYAAQARWAMACARGESAVLPPFLPDAAFKLPGRLARMIFNAFKKALYSRLARDGIVLRNYRRIFRNRDISG
jgi:glycosyltransferase involved in cell wall biosynthesis